MNLSSAKSPDQVGCAYDSTSFELGWDAPIGCGFKEYRLLRRQTTDKDEDPEWTRVTTFDRMNSLLTTAYPEPVTEPRAQYEYKLSVINENNGEHDSNMESVTMTDDVPPNVTFTAEDATPGEGLYCARVHLAWGAAAANDACDITAFKVRRSGGDRPDSRASRPPPR